MLQILVIAAVALVPVSVFAFDIVATFWDLIARMFLFGVSLMGFVLILLVKGLILVAQYSNFVAPGPTAVRIGWVVVRDLSNMFFILILLIMAFAIIVGASRFGDMKTVIRLFIMAVVVNFSKTICGIFIDLGQVVMLTFVNGFAQAAGGNFLNAFQVNKLLSLKNSGQFQGSGLALAAALAFVMIAVATTVVVVMLITLSFRIVMLWILIILSPLAFMGSAFPPAKAQTYDKWWSEFRKYIVGGPVLAFFLWLALITAQQTGGNIATGEKFIDTSAPKTASDQEIAQQNSAVGIPSDAAGEDSIISLIIITCILIGGLKVAQETGGITGGGVASFLGNTVKGYAKKGGLAAARFGWNQTGGRVTSAAGAGLRSAAGAGLRATQGLALRAGGATLRGITGGRIGAGLTTRGKAIQQEQREARRRLYERFTGAPEERAKLSEAQAGAAVKSLAGRTDAKGLKEGVEKMMSDKNLANAAKKDPASVEKTYRNLEEAAKTDQNLNKTKSEFQQKFWDKLTDPGTPDRKKALARLSNDDYTGMNSEEIKKAVPDMSAGGFKALMSGSDEQKKALMDGLKQMKLPVDAGDLKKGFKNADEKDVEQYLRDRRVEEKDIPKDMYQVPGMASYAFNETKNDSRAREALMRDDTKSEALQGVAASSLAAALAKVTDTNPNSAEIADATIQSISVGKIDAQQISGDSDEARKIQEALSRSLNPATLMKNINQGDQKQVDAAKAAMTVVMAQHPDRDQKYRKSDAYDTIMPDQAQVDRARERRTARTQAPSGGAQRDAQGNVTNLKEGPPIELA